MKIVTYNLHMLFDVDTIKYLLSYSLLIFFMYCQLILISIVNLYNQCSPENFLFVRAKEISVCLCLSGRGTTTMCSAATPRTTTTSLLCSGTLDWHTGCSIILVKLIVSCIIFLCDLY